MIAIGIIECVLFAAFIAIFWHFTKKCLTLRAEANKLAKESNEQNKVYLQQTAPKEVSKEAPAKAK